MASASDLNDLRPPNATKPELCGLERDRESPRGRSRRIRIAGIDVGEGAAKIPTADSLGKSLKRQDASEAVRDGRRESFLQWGS